MHSGKIVFAQIMEHLPVKDFHRCVDRYHDRKVHRFSCLDQFLAMAFAQLTYRENLRDISACLEAQRTKRDHMGIRSDVSRSTLAYANETRDWKIYADFAQVLIHTARRLYAHDDFGVELDQTVYALDSTTIDLCLSMFPWARFRKHTGAVKLQTLLDLRGNIPTFIRISDGKLHDVKVLDEICPEPGSFYIMDRGYLDFERLYRMAKYLAFFVTRSKSNLGFRRLYSHPVEKATGVQSDQTIIVTGFYAAKDYPDKMRRVRFFDEGRKKYLTFLTNNFLLPSLAIAQLYKCRWQVELFFKWIKQHLRIKRFVGTSENAVKSQIWIAVSVYVLVAILKKRLKLDASLYTILQILSVTVFETIPILQALEGGRYRMQENNMDNQMNLFS